MRTLAIPPAALGDFLLTCPALRILSLNGPLDLLGRTNTLDLAVAAGIATTALSMADVEFSTLLTSPSETLKRFLKTFDRAIVWLPNHADVHAALLSLGLHHVEAFPHIPPHNWAHHASLYYLNCLGIHDAPPLRLEIPPAAISRDIIIHPGSSDVHKNWPVARFTSLADQLRTRGRSITWAFGPAQNKLPAPGPGAELRGLSLLQLAREIAAADLYIGNDTGTTHLATAVGCPTIAIFGPGRPDIWGPRGYNVTIIHKRPWPRVPDVLAAIYPPPFTAQQ